ncbi:MAG: hypothetical protein H0V09_06735 [Gemmatimonadetes bacterium]|nr:hypothetical protein [Gemmatimonadota bacterium]
MASVLLRPGVMSLLDVVTRGGGVTLAIEELAVPRGSPVAERTLGELEIGGRTGALVVAVRPSTTHGGSGLLFNPSSATALREEDTLIVMGEQDQIRALRGLMEVVA